MRLSNSTFFVFSLLYGTKLVGGAALKTIVYFKSITVSALFNSFATAICNSDCFLQDVKRQENLDISIESEHQKCDEVGTLLEEEKKKSAELVLQLSERDEQIRLTN